MTTTTSPTTEVSFYLHHHELPTIEAYMGTQDFVMKSHDFLRKNAVRGPERNDKIERYLA